MTRVWAWLLPVALAAAACSDAATVDDACRAVCACESPLPSANDACVDLCVAVFTDDPRPAACIECLATVTCDLDEGADRCENLCDDGLTPIP
jgi:hypothetical protein